MGSSLGVFRQSKPAQLDEVVAPNTSCPASLIIARSPTCPVLRDAGDSAEYARLRSLPDCQAEDALFAARPLQAWHLVLGAPLFAVAATT